MKLLYILLLYTIRANSAQTLQDNSITTIDIVLSGIKDQSWEDDERPCLNQTVTILYNVRNYTVWAVWIWNSMQNPAGIFYGSEYSLGNYDQCISASRMSGAPKIITQYCLADVTLTGNKNGKHDKSVLGSTEPYVSIKTNTGRNLNKVIWGTCLPSVCKPQSISKILKTIYLANPVTPAEPNITVKASSCQVAGKVSEHTFGYFAFLSLMTSLIIVSVLSTYYTHYSTVKPTGALQNIADSFCLSRNWSSLTKESREEIGILNLFKVSIAIVVIGTHLILFKNTGPMSNGLQIDELLLNVENPFIRALKHIDLPVDSFFMISGLLLIKGLMRGNKKPLVSLIRRYFRLTASFAIVIFYVSAVFIYAGDGPIWQRFASKEQKACSENWLLSLLMLNNYLNSENICLIVSWYIPCDYQLAVMGTILFLVWKKNKSMGKVISTITAVLAILIPGVVTYWRGLPEMITFLDFEKLKDIRKNDVYLDTYIRSHNRAGPYIVGMAMGYVLSIYNSSKYRTVISRKWSILLFVIANMVLCKILMYVLAWSTSEYDYVSSAMYAGYSRTMWALASCLIVGIVEYGDVGPLRNVINWHGFTIISRLTYGIYLCHSILLQQYVYSSRSLQQLDMLHLEITYVFGIFVASGFLATLLWLFVEAPVNNIASILINGSIDKSGHVSTEDKIHETECEQCAIKLKAY